MKNRRSREAVAATSVVVIVCILCILLIGGDDAERKAPPSPPIPAKSDAAARHSAPVINAAVEPEAGSASPLVYVRDLANEKPVVGVRFEVVRGGETLRLTSDSDGAIFDFPTDADSLRCLSDVWFAPTLDVSATLRSREIWVHRQMEVIADVRVVPSDDREFDASEVDLLLRPLGSGLKGPERMLFEARLAQLGIRSERIARPNANGIVRFRAPRLPGLLLMAAHAGWRPASAEIPLPAEGVDVTHVSLIFEGAPTLLRGRVIGSDGGPIERAMVQAHIVVEMPIEEFDPLAVKGVGHAYTRRTWYEGERGRVRVKYIIFAESRADGTFEMNANVFGDLYFVVHPPEGHGVHRSHLGWFGGDGVDAELAPPPAPLGAVVKLVSEGKPVASELIVISNLSVAPIQPAFSIRSDDAGRIPARWFEHGSRYKLVCPSEPYVEFTWNGQVSLDLSELVRRNIDERKRADAERGR